MAAVQTTTTAVRAWDGKLTTTDGAFANPKVTSVLKAIGYFDAARKSKYDCGGNFRLEGGLIRLPLPVANMGMSEALR